MPTESLESWLAVFAYGVELVIYMSIMGGLLLGTLKLIRSAIGIGSDVR